MRVTDKVVAVTGGGSGIGAALCSRFAREGARAVAVIDLDESRAREVAAQVGGLALGCDVTGETNLVAAIEHVESGLGPIDLFCSNAGVRANDVDVVDPASGSDAGWDVSWKLHVMSYMWAARRLGPAIVRRGGGYFFKSVDYLRSGAYSATNHAAIGFAESSRSLTPAGV